MTIIAVFGVKQVESIAECDQLISVSITDLIGRSNSIAEILNTVCSFGHILVRPITIKETMNLWFSAPTEHSNRIAFLRFFRLFTMK